MTVIEKIPVPSFDGDYVHIYKPKGDVYKGKNTFSFETGKFYENWKPNDFSITKYDGKWHMIGITEPFPKGFVNGYVYETGAHECEHQLFHCVAEGDSFADVLYEDAFKDEPKILYPQDRPGEAPEIWAPHIMELDGEMNVIYSPWAMRRASTKDFKEWTLHGAMFYCREAGARDPYIFVEDGKYYFIYTASERLWYKVSDDMVNWSENKLLQDVGYLKCEKESPFLLKRGDYYYLFWSIWDGRNGSFDQRTMVFAGKTFEDLRNSAPITMLDGHAPEFVKDDNGDYYMLSVYYPNNGISAVKLKWE